MFHSTRSPLTVPVLGLVGALCGCGSILTGSDLGPPLAQLHATVSQNTTTAAIKAPYGELLWAAPFYFGPGDTEPMPIGIESGHALAPIHGDFPSGFTLDVYDPPPEELLNPIYFTDATAEATSVITFSLATLVVFDDLNGDQDFDLVDSRTGAPTSNWGAGVTFAPDQLRGWMEHGAVMYVADLPDRNDPKLKNIFANPELLGLGFQSVIQCHLAGTPADTRFQVLSSTTPFAVRMVEPIDQPVQESAALWFDDAAALPDCVP